MNKTFIILILVIVFCLVVGGSLIPRFAWTQDINSEVLRSTWVITDIRSIGFLDISRDYSQEYTGKTRAEMYAHSLQATAPEGSSRVFNVLSLSPTGYGNKFWSGTHIGYDSAGTTGQLTSKEQGDVTICRDGSGLSMGAGFEAELTRGVIHSNMRTDPIISPTSSYDLSANVYSGRVETGVSALSAYSNADDGIYAQGSYTQRIAVEGAFHIYYSANVDLDRHSPCCPWQ